MDGAGQTFAPLPRRWNASSAERPFLEREDEIGALEEWFDDVGRSGAGVFLLVSGDAGVGKTTLLRRFIEGRRRAPAFWGVCDPLVTPAPLGPVVEVATQLNGAAAAVVSGAARPYEVGRALLEDLAAESSPVVVFEDLHWADGGSVDVLIYLARRIERTPALVIGTYRDDGLSSASRLQAALGLLATTPRVERLRFEAALARGGTDARRGVRARRRGRVCGDRR
jgi:predicted ATPase